MRNNDYKGSENVAKMSKVSELVRRFTSPIRRESGVDKSSEAKEEKKKFR